MMLAVERGLSAKSAIELVERENGSVREYERASENAAMHNKSDRNMTEGEKLVEDAMWTCAMSRRR